MKILIVKPSSLGDIIHAIPAVHALSLAYPGAVIDWVVNPAFADLIRFLPFVRRIIFFERKKMGTVSGFLPAFFRIFKAIRKEKYDVVIDLQGLLRSALIARLAKAKVYAGFSRPKEDIARRFYNRRVPVPDSAVHAVAVNNQMVRILFNLKNPDFSFTLPKTEPYVSAAQKLTANLPEGKTIGFAVGARWRTKQWPPDFFADVIHKLHEQFPDTGIVLTGGKSDAILSRKILSSMPDIPILDLCGKTSVGELAEVIRKCCVFISNDSGPMHISAIEGVPVIAFFGPTDPDLTGPYTDKKIVFSPDLPCIRCFKRYCDNPKCHDFPDPQEVVDRIADYLSKGSDK